MIGKEAAATFYQPHTFGKLHVAGGLGGTWEHNAKSVDLGL
jgi:hypothetical protein